MSRHAQPISSQFAQIDRRSVRARVYFDIKQKLIQGKLQPGQTITIESLATAFGTSHMPVREALGRLVSENALVELPNRSVAVPVVAKEILRDIMQVRVHVEGMAVRMAAEAITEEEFASLMRHHRAMAAAIRKNDIEAYLAIHQEFHFGIYAASGSKVLPSIIETLWLQCGPYLNLYLSHGFQPNGLEHDSILAALKNRQPAEAEAAICHGILAALRSISALIEEPA